MPLPLALLLLLGVAGEGFGVGGGGDGDEEDEAEKRRALETRAEARAAAAAVEVDDADVDVVQSDKSAAIIFFSLTLSGKPVSSALASERLERLMAILACARERLSAFDSSRARELDRMKRMIDWRTKK